MREAASRGFWVSSYAPFGYNRVMVPDGARNAPPCSPTRMPPASSSTSSTLPRRAKG